MIKYLIKEILILKYIVFIFCLFMNLFSLYSEDIDNNEDNITENNSIIDPNDKKEYLPILLGKIGYSFLSDKNILLGLDLALDHRYPEQWEWLFIKHIIGIDYQYIFSNNKSIFRLNYTYQLMPLFPIGGPGISFLYNVNNNDIGIAPQICIHIFYLSFYYRYYLIINDINNSFHDIILTINIPIYRRNIKK